MRKVIAAINLTLDGFCDHTVMIADEELHDHYTDLLRNAGAMLYGRTTYLLMENYWPAVVKNPTGNRSMDDFAVALENIPKIVFSRTLDKVEWKNVKLAKESLEEEVLALRQQPGEDIFVGSPGLISSLTNLNLIGEYQLCVHPVIAGSGLPLFKDISGRIVLKRLKTKNFGSGAMVHYYEPVSV